VWEKILDFAAKNSPLLLIIIGLAIFIIGAAGTLPYTPLQVKESGWRIALAVMGAIVVGFGALLFFRERNNKESSLRADEYGLEIQSHEHRDLIDYEVVVSGTYKVKPPDGSVVLLEMNPDSRHYWFKDFATFDEGRKRWRAKGRIGAPSGETRELIVAVIGKNGKALRDYYFKVGRRTNQWPGIETLTTDVIECAKVTVIKK